MKINRKLEIMTCSDCGIYYGMTEDIIKKRLDDGEVFYCTNGHTQYFVESRESKLKRIQAMLARKRTSEIIEEVTKSA